MQLFTALVLGVMTSGSILVDFWLVEFELTKITHSLTAVTVSYILFRVILGGLVRRNVKERKTAFLFRRLLSAIFYVVVSLWVITVWVEDAETLLLSYGLVTAGVALALQDVFKNVIGGLVLLLNGTYHVGDRVEIDGKVGDVIAIDLTQTVLLEIREWVDGDLPTGRMTFLPNKLVLTESVYNYTKDHGFIWDEIPLPVTHESDWKAARELMMKVAEGYTKTIHKEVEAQMEHMHAKYFFRQNPLQPRVFVELNSNWILLTVRYVTKTMERRETKSLLFDQILESIKAYDAIEIGSDTLRIQRD